MASGYPKGFRICYDASPYDEQTVLNVYYFLCFLFRNGLVKWKLVLCLSCTSKCLGWMLEWMIPPVWQWELQMLFPSWSWTLPFQHGSSSRLSCSLYEDLWTRVTFSGLCTVLRSRLTLVLVFDRAMNLKGHDYVADSLPCWNSYLRKPVGKKRLCLCINVLRCILNRNTQLHCMILNWGCAMLATCEVLKKTLINILPIGLLFASLFVQFEKLASIIWQW